MASGTVFCLLHAVPADLAVHHILKDQRGVFCQCLRTAGCAAVEQLCFCCPKGESLSDDPQFHHSFRAGGTAEHRCRVHGQLRALALSFSREGSDFHHTLGGHHGSSQCPDGAVLSDFQQGRPFEFSACPSDSLRCHRPSGLHFHYPLIYGDHPAGAGGGRLCGRLQFLRTVL